MAQPVFLAAAWSSLGDETLVDKLLVGLQVTSGGRLRAGDVFVPGLHAGEPGVETTADAAFERTLAALQASRVVVAVLDGGRTSDDVAFLVAYAFAAGKPVIGFATERRQVPSHLVRGACAEIVGDVKTLGEALARRLTS
ncbi:MAG TPA: nucleoside 2-deoxyribosyltransferase [Candidatus Thermoplasmatota archaeon]|nr:nucleoside 2-deoxyribosyltransferase [Candidatus Thermoplasmatota archaeon]